MQLSNGVTSYFTTNFTSTQEWQNILDWIREKPNFRS